ncbi:MAG: IS3 family transposase [Chloroflexota bacterium]|nr:IS3 family transposase [Chloroflexota bacterium]
MIGAAERLGEEVGVSKACRTLGVPRRSLYRARKPKADAKPRPAPPRALSAEERQEVRAVLNRDRFCDSSPREVYATLLDEEGIYLCHWRTMYRVLEEHDELHERRRQGRHPKRVKPELRATKPNEVWSWDITRLRGYGNFYYLYTIMDVFSRYVTGWMIAKRESGELAEKLIAETCAKQGIEQDQLILHSDRGSAMRSKTVADLLGELGVAKSHTRPYTPTDNPYSESQFKTMKYQPDYPEKFEGLTHARGWAREFFQWYHHEHRHTGLALMTPAMVHYGQVESVQEQRQEVLDAAYMEHPERFVGGRPTPPQLPEEVWINQPREVHDDVPHSDRPAVRGREPGAQAGSRESKATLDADEHLATLERPLVPADKTSIFLRKFERELCQSR